MNASHSESGTHAQDERLSPSERYARAQARSEHPLLAEFEAQLSFPLDQFQRASCQSLESGRSVLVAAPTGAGKTIIAEFAIELAMHSLDDRAFYTAPIKALSNQKFHELCDRYGSDQVGLLTGDTAINPEARIIVMTTEVLRNMLYAQSDSLRNLAFVVLDEVHYLADKFRGAVWEEIILHLPKTVKLVSLSATVSNAEEFGDWMHAVRGDTDVIVSEHRPVPLYQHVLTPGSFLPLFIGDHTGINKTRATINPDITRLARTARGGSRSHSGGRSRGSGSYAARQRSISRSDIARALERESLLPAIVFVFSRKGCDAAVAACVREGIRLVTQEERESIRAVALERTAAINVEDLAALNFHEWLTGLERGIAAHHAGLLPVFKEVVEDLFQQRLVKIVFATETLALGINMPAKSVVIEKLDKFNGESRVQLTAGEFTQLTGRAGRRGIDHEGHSVVVWHDNMNPDELGQLASKRSYPLLSSFKPTYNMTVNLLDRFGYAKARSILEMSFAQFQADRDTADLVWQVKNQEESLAGYQESMTCHLGNFVEYANIRASIKEIESGSRPSRARGKAKTAHERNRMNSVQDLRAQLTRHPCHRCDELESHLRWGERYTKLRKQTDTLKARIRQRTGSIARQFDRVTQLLTRVGYVQPDQSGPVIAGWGHDLKLVFGERDLLVIECLRQKAWSELEPASLAALVAALVFEPRRDEEGSEHRVPRGPFRNALLKTQEIWATLDELEEELSLPQTNQLSAAASLAMFEWANGGALERVLDSADLSAGDFVRLTKQTIDLLDQISAVAPEPVSSSAARAKNLLKHGIVALSTVAA